jgi:hypothetical protein
MSFGTPAQVERLAGMDVQVMHTNLAWPYFPLRRDGGGLVASEREAMHRLVRACHARKMKVVLGLPPFMPVALVRAHPNWRIHPDDTGSIDKVVAVEKDLGTRSGCNLGPWGTYLVDLCAELAGDYDLDGFSFDGNYHPSICYCPACKKAYREGAGRNLPRSPDLKDVSYREYLAWRGARLIEHYRALKERIARARPGTVLMTWTVNAGRYGHFLHSPRAMPVELNRLIDVPMQEWWLDETNRGASIAPAFGAAYLRAVAGDAPCACEPYLMSRGNPYGTDSFPQHERRARSFLALTHGSIAAHSIGWPGHEESTRELFAEVKKIEPWLVRTRSLPWAGMLVSEPTRQFVAFEDIAGCFLPHVFGAFRAAVEEHLPVTLLTDADLTPQSLASFRVLVLPGAVALSEAQVKAIGAFVRGGGGLVASGETSLCDEVGRPRKDFALADLFGVSYRGRPAAPVRREALDENFKVALDADYWKQRQGVARLSWLDHALVGDEVLGRLVPTRAVTFRGPLTAVSEPASGEVAWRMTPEGWTKPSLPGAVGREVGKGRVVYLAAALDAAMWSYAYPYQRRLLARAIEWTARTPPPVRVLAPMCVHAALYTQGDETGKRVVIHLFNNLSTTALHGLPSAEVPLREETVPIHDIRIRFAGALPRRCTLQPAGRELRLSREGKDLIAQVPRLELHALVVAEW